MFHITPEGETPKVGFNFYPRHSGQYGVKLFVFNRLFAIRWSTMHKRFYFWYVKETELTDRVRSSS